MAAMKLIGDTAASSTSATVAAPTNSGTSAASKIDGSSGHAVKKAGGVITHRTVP